MEPPTDVPTKRLVHCKAHIVCRWDTNSRRKQRTNRCIIGDVILPETGKNIPKMRFWISRSAMALFEAAERTRSSADADNRIDAFSGQSRSTNIWYHSICYIFYSYCAIVTLSLRRAVFTIFVFKNFMTLKWGSKVNQGHWEWYHSIDCLWFPISVL